MELLNIYLSKLNWVKYSFVENKSLVYNSLSYYHQTEHQKKNEKSQNLISLLHVHGILRLIQGRPCWIFYVSWTTYFNKLWWSLKTWSLVQPKKWFCSNLKVPIGWVLLMLITLNSCTKFDYLPFKFYYVNPNLCRKPNPNHLNCYVIKK